MCSGVAHRASIIAASEGHISGDALYSSDVEKSASLEKSD